MPKMGIGIGRVRVTMGIGMSTFSFVPKFPSIGKYWDLTGASCGAADLLQQRVFSVILCDTDKGQLSLRPVTK